MGSPLHEQNSNRVQDAHDDEFIPWASGDIIGRHRKNGFGSDFSLGKIEGIPDVFIYSSIYWIVARESLW
jgi:hypothetical protein